MWCKNFFHQMKVFIEIHNRAKFRLHRICGCQVIHLQSFSYQQKGAFWAAFGWFFMHYNPKSIPICTKLSQVMQCKVKYHICYRFWFIIENSSNWTKKPYFWCFFRGFWATPSDSLSTTPKYFVKWKVSWRYTTVPSFIFIAFVVLKL